MRRTLLTALLLLVVPAAPAEAARRYAAPDGSLTSPTCAATDPCSVERAVNLAAAGDEVVVGAGSYSLTEALKPAGPISVHGDRDHSAPKLVAPASLGVLLTLNGGTVSHLALHATGKDKLALRIESGVADGVIVDSNAGDGAVLVASDGATVMRNSVVRSTDPSGGATGLELKDHGKSASVALRNVTVVAVAGSATAIECDLGDSTASIVNTIARGKAVDIDADGACAVAYSNFRPDFSSGVAAGAGNQSAEPVFADGDYRPAAGSPTIDAGALDAFATSPDPDGQPRTVGTAPDIGAYEYVPPPAGDGPAAGLPEELKGVPPPQQGHSVVVAAASGTVRVREPGATRFSVLSEPGRIPVGSLVDARRGQVQLVTAVSSGIQAGKFWGAAFKTAQRRRGAGMTTLALRGGTVCRTRGAEAVASRRHKRKRKRRRSLWSRDNGGLYRTRGNDSVATARGTKWLTRDRCDGTVTRVREGAVSVRDLRRHRRVLVKAGHAYFARAAKR